MTQLLTSLNEIKSFGPCASGWRAILAGQGKTEADGELFPLSSCLESNSFSDVCWLLGKRGEESLVAVRAARLCAHSVLSYRSADHAASYADEATNYADDAAANYAAANYEAAADAANAAAEAAGYAGDDAAAQLRLNKNFLLQEIQRFELDN